MQKTLALAALLALTLFVAPREAAAACKLQMFAELPVTMMGSKPIVSTKINGHDAQLIADSGAFFSLITPASAQSLGLWLRAAPSGFYVQGVKGRTDVSIGTARDFTVAGQTLHRIEFLVGGNAFDASMGLLGQNLLSAGDVEYDLANGAIRLFHPVDCGRANFAYWSKDGAYSVTDVTDAKTERGRHTIGDVSVNGVRMRALFDTGASTSIIGLSAAARAGMKPKGAGVVSTGAVYGIGRESARTWIAPIASFKIGDEEIRNTRISIGDIDVEDEDMVLGADFFLSHRVYVANSQRKLYLTYNGGPVFNLSVTPMRQTAPDQPLQAAPPLDEGRDEPTDAAGFARRGAAFASRGALEKAIADLDRACALAPAEPQYVYERGKVHARAKQPFLAMADFDQAIKLKPDDVAALIARAALRLAGHDTPGAIADLDAADRAAGKEDNVRRQMASLYELAERLPAAIAQDDLWIAAHPDDIGLAGARNGRCWARALLNQELDKALADCNVALRLGPKMANVLDSRGLVRLRRGDMDGAIADYDAAISLNPKVAWSLYGRGVAKTRKGLVADGAADMAAATALRPDMAAEARKWGVTP